MLSRATETLEVGGGAWRVKWHPSPSRKHDLLVACMHDGCKVIHTRGLLEGESQVLQRHDRHESMAYGVDWSFGEIESTKTLVASCSFYDHALHLWEG